MRVRRAASASLWTGVAVASSTAAAAPRRRRSVVGQVARVEALDEADSRKVAGGSGDDHAFRPAGDVPFSAMRLIVARCEVRYSGRLDALLPEALRLLMIKSDGSVMVHADTGGYKPQNCVYGRASEVG